MPLTGEASATAGAGVGGKLVDPVAVPYCDLPFPRWISAMATSPSVRGTSAMTSRISVSCSASRRNGGLNPESRLPDGEQLEIRRMPCESELVRVTRS